METPASLTIHLTMLGIDSALGWSFLDLSQAVGSLSSLDADIPWG